jgi:hypothetical protein
MVAGMKAQADKHDRQTSSQTITVPHVVSRICPSATVPE